MITDRIGLYLSGSAFLATALVAGWLAFGKASVTRDLKRTVMHVETICAATGTPYRLDERGRILPRDKWGVGCLAAVQRLVSDAATRATVALDAVTDHRAEQVKLNTADAGAVRTHEARRTKAKRKLEAIHATATDNHVGPDWFDALGDLAGLPELGEAEAGTGPASGADAEGPAVAGPAEVRDTTVAVLEGG